MKSRHLALLVALAGYACLSPAPAKAQAFPPGTFAIDGIPVNCGPVVVVLNPALPDVGMADGMGHIFLNPQALGGLPTVLKLYWFAHECGHYNVGASEVAADCWAIRTGRSQGWFPPKAFHALEAMFRNNPGDMAHPSGPRRVQNMIACYRQP